MDATQEQIESFLSANPMTEGAPEPAQAEPEKAEPTEAEAESTEEKEPEDKGPKKTPRQLLEEGDLDAAFEAAFGKKPSEFKIDSRAWATWRQRTKHEKQKIQAREQEVAKIAKLLENNYAPLAQAQRAYDEGDYETFVKLVTGGDDISEFNRKLLQSYHGKNPEVEKLKRELAAERRQREERAEQERMAQEQARQAQERAQYMQTIQSELAASGDPRLSRAAKKAPFVNMVFNIQAEYWDPEAQSTLPLAEAAEMAWKELYDEVVDFSDRAPEPAKAVQGEPPAKPGTKVPTSLKRSQAAEVGSPGRRLSDDEQLEKFTRQMKQAGWG